MVRAPCCDKLGMNRGPWTQEEDDILVGHIHRNGHGNWRALPKQAGLLRCGKSCRLRWINYLRPDIKRGNYSMEEEDTIISLHELLGNRWSAIAARLPGRTDNEIKNVWHTHLKKRALPIQALQKSKRKSKRDTEREKSTEQPTFEALSLSPERSCNDISCSGTDSSVTTGDNSIAGLKEVIMDSPEEFVEIDDSFWSEALSMDDNSIPPTDLETLAWPLQDPISDPMISFGSSEDDMSFWLRIFLEAGDLQDLPKL